MHIATRQERSNALLNLGNCWLIAATIAHEIMSAEHQVIGAPFVVSIDAEGTVTAVGPGHPDYAARVARPGMVCTADAVMPVERLAGRIRDAAMDAFRSKDS